MVQFRCKCGKAYSAEEKHKGKQVTCQQCKATITIPSAQAPRQAPPQQESTPPKKSPEVSSPPDQSSKLKSLAPWIGIGAGVLVVIILVSLFASKRKATLDVTEKANAQILSLKSEGDSAIQAKEFDNAILKYNELLKFAKDNNISEADADDPVSQALRDTADSIIGARREQQALEVSRLVEERLAEQKQKEAERKAKEARRLAEQKRGEEERQRKVREQKKKIVPTRKAEKPKNPAPFSSRDALALYLKRKMDKPQKYPNRNTGGKVTVAGVFRLGDVTLSQDRAHVKGNYVINGKAAHPFRLEFVRDFDGWVLSKMVHYTSYFKEWSDTQENMGWGKKYKEYLLSPEK